MHCYKIHSNEVCSFKISLNVIEEAFIKFHSSKCNILLWGFSQLDELECFGTKVTFMKFDLILQNVPCSYDDLVNLANLNALAQRWHLSFQNVQYSCEDSVNLEG